MIPTSDQYWLRNAHVPNSLMVRSKQGRSKDWSNVTQSVEDDLLLVDLEIAAGAIASIATAGTLTEYGSPSMDLRGGLVFPCWVDMHTHLDKAHIWDQHPNPDGTFERAIEANRFAAQQPCEEKEIYQRMEFALKCSYAHGTKAIRTHLDSGEEHRLSMSLDVFQTLQKEWANRLILQVVCLVSLDEYLTPRGEKLAARMAEVGGVLGGVGWMNPGLEAQIDRAFSLARDHHLTLDFHVDETDDPESTLLLQIAQATLRHHYQGKVVCGHCCNLATQPPEQVKKTISLVKKAKIGIVSLPLCNLYLQDRQPNRTPRWRGVTLLHELKQAGVPVAIASDNCRDPFYAYGDHDALEVFSLSTKIAHLDHPIGHWCRAITSTPADLMNLPTVGRIGVGIPADLVVFKARRYSELLSRSQHDRVVLRNGQAIDTTLPDYAELDDLSSEFLPTSL